MKDIVLNLLLLVASVVAVATVVAMAGFFFGIVLMSFGISANTAGAAAAVYSICLGLLLVYLQTRKTKEDEL